MRTLNRLQSALSVVLLLSLVSLAYARHCFCHHCGCSGTCNKVCRLVCEEKKVDVICWGALCEEFCVPCYGKRGCEHCEVVCGECDCDPETPASKPKRFLWTEWLPTKAEMHTRTKLMKKTITKTVPTYKWVVEELCPHCQSRCEYASVTPDVELPPMPVDDAVVLYGKLSTEEGTARE
jgi:hypothetical protein